MISKNSLKFQGFGMLGVLILQYILGITVNLFIKFPDSGTPGQFWEFAWSMFPVALHIIVGILLLIGSLIFIIRSFIYKNYIWKIASTVGFIGVLTAGFSGASFIPTQDDMYSFIMSLGFMIAFLSYAIGIYIAK